MLFNFLLSTILWGQPEPNAAIPDFTLSNEKGVPVLLSEEASQQGVVLVFIGTDCPITQRYAPRLEALKQSFEPRGIRFLGISSNVQDAQAEVVRFSRDFSISFPILKDVSGTVASQLGAQRTPEVFVIDRELKVRYRGRIDSQLDHHSDRPMPPRPDLEIALEEVLSGREVSVPSTRVVGCRIGRSLQEREGATVFWHDEVASLFRKHCISCHRNGGAAPFPLVRYEDIEGWGETIREVLRGKQMPPWYAHGSVGLSTDLAISEQDRTLITKWINDGCPRGDSSADDFSAPPSSNWRIAAEPDQVVSMSSSPIDLPAEGRQEYRTFLVDPKWTSTQLVRSMEIRPSNRRLVWHASVFVIPPGLANAYPSLRDLASTPELDANLLAWYSAGSAPVVYPEDIAREIPAGSQLLFRILYRPMGRTSSDKTQIAFVWADPNKVSRSVRIIPLREQGIVISKNQPTRQVSANVQFDENLFLLSVTPSMTPLGQRYQLNFPPDSSDGSVQALLSVEPFPFLWQHQYRLTLPLELAAGLELSAQATFDRLSSDERHRGDEDEDQDENGEERPSEECRVISYLEVAPPPPPPVAEVPLPLADPTKNISMAIGGLAATTALCLVFLWFKSAQTAPRPTEPTPVAADPPTV